MVNDKQQRLIQLLTSVAKLGSREFVPLLLPISVGGEAAGKSGFPSPSWRITELSGAKNILQHLR